MIEFLRKYSLAAWALFSIMLTYMVVDIFDLPEAFLWISKIAVIIVIFKKSKTRIIDRTSKYLIYTFIVWLICEGIRAITLAENYWMTKNVVNQLLLALFYGIIFLGANLKIVKEYFAIYWKLFIPMAIISIIAYGTPLNYNYVPFSILMLFIGVIPRKHAWLLIFIMLLYFIASEQRNDMVKIILSSLIGLTIYFFSLPKLILKVGHVFFLIIPIILLWLGITGSFNVFKMDEYIKGDFTQQVITNDGLQEDNLKADTRTFIYNNVFYTLLKYDAFIFGRSPALGDEGFQGSWGRDEATGLVGRYGNEVGVMDILLWYGIIGVIIYFLIFARASYLAIYKSRNKYIKASGLYVSFLWTWSFIWEKPLVETFFMMDLILLGMCFSKEFRMMNDIEVKEWVRSIFLVRTRRRFLKTL